MAKKKLTALHSMPEYGVEAGKTFSADQGDVAYLVEHGFAEDPAAAAKAAKAAAAAIADADAREAALDELEGDLAAREAALDEREGELNARAVALEAAEAEAASAKSPSS